jgi:hypothetical protein
MRILEKKIIPLAAIFTFFTSDFCLSQNTKFNINSTISIDQLINEKRKVNPSISLNERYKIQIFSGENEKAKKIIIQFKQEFKNIDATIIFKTPNYKVWVGSFKTRMEAERNLIEIKKKYKNVLLIKPGK